MADFEQVSVSSRLLPLFALGRAGEGGV